MEELIIGLAFALFVFIVLWFSTMNEYHKAKKKILEKYDPYKGDVPPMFYEDYK